MLKDKLEYIGRDPSGKKYYYMDIKDDAFIHFTTSKRAPEIIASKKILLKSPYEKFGAYGTFAVSLTFGKHIPNVSLKHINKWTKEEDSTIVAVEFKTNTTPNHLGYIDEVSWGEKDINLIDPKIISKEEAIKKIKDSPIDLDDDSAVVYDKNFIPKLNIIQQKQAYNVLMHYLKN